MRLIILLCASILLFACPAQKENSIGFVERLDAELDKILDKNATIELLADGFTWSEGPVWIEQHNMLLFSDVPKNTIYKWTEANGAELYLTPSGFTGAETQSREPGSNGLLLDDKGNLVLCQHGDRRMAYMDAPLNNPKPEFVTLADDYNGNKFNSPNDAAYYNGELYFTDPPYGLPEQEHDPSREIPFQGVYKISKNGTVILLIDSLTRPNGIAFTPEGAMIVANSDGQKARWYTYVLNDSSIISGEILYDATDLVATEKGLPDGLKIDSKGNIFATGPGGVFIFNPSGKLIGKIKLTEASSNCALSGDEKMLYVTNHRYVIRVSLK
ncbi:MAG: SMP-30/gluconolactonase/LRE family protein [Cyclobacteriaceae bacterium]|nr:SMP-30/gluconolactonase/LRE family protein [Cyclobacteriaceae bacterium]